MRILLIGAGAIAHHHAAAARLLPASAILAADPSPEARAKFAAAFREATLFDTPEAMLATPKGPDDIAVVAVPPWLHAPMTLMAFAAGYHVLCEKPLARTLPELDQMLSAAARARRELGDCAIRFNAQPAMTAARAALAEGATGTLTLVRMVQRNPRMRPGIEYQPSSRWFLDPDKAGGGVLMDWSVYDLSMLFDVLRPTAVTVESAHMSRITGRDDPPDHPARVESHVTAMLRLTLSDGQTVPLLYERANGVNGPALAELSVEGMTGGLTWQWLPPYENDTTKLTRFTDAGPKVDPVTETLPMGTHPHYHHQPLLALAARIRGEPSAALTPIDLRFNFATIAAIQSTATGGGPMTVTRT